MPIWIVLSHSYFYSKERTSTTSIATLLFLLFFDKTKPDLNIFIYHFYSWFLFIIFIFIYHFIFIGIPTYFGSSGLITLLRALDVMRSASTNGTYRDDNEENSVSHTKASPTHHPGDGDDGYGQWYRKHENEVFLF